MMTTLVTSYAVVLETKYTIFSQSKIRSADLGLKLLWTIITILKDNREKIPGRCGDLTCCPSVEETDNVSDFSSGCRGRDRHGSWIYNYLSNQFPSPLTLWLRIPLRRSVLDTTLSDQVCQWLVAGLWFSPGNPVSSTNRTDDLKYWWKWR